jgi:pyridoxamine 5'-phosphate oxidase
MLPVASVPADFFGGLREEPMTLNDCTEFVRRNPNGFLATIDGDRPRVRPMTVWDADISGFYFYTSEVKPLMSQLRADPKVEIAFFEPGTPPDLGVLLRMAGQIEIVADMNVRRKLYEAMPWLKKIGTGTPDCPTIVVFRIAAGQYNFWTWENNINPGPWIPFP